MRQAALETFFTRALAITLVVVAHGFALNVPHPPSAALGVAYAGSVVCLAVAAGLLWRRTMD
jgi:hypothetical protein